MSHEKKDSALQKMQLILLSAAIMIVLAQLNINLIINGFKISLAVICLPLFAFLFDAFSGFPGYAHYSTGYFAGTVHCGVVA